MTTASARGGYCTQHHQPRSKCEPWDRHTRSNRYRDDMYADVERVAKEDGSDATRFLTEAAEARLDRARCYRCALDADPVPLEFGDLTGRPMDEWITEAVREVVAQHPRHAPVRVGAGERSAEPVSHGSVPFISPAVKR